MPARRKPRDDMDQRVKHFGEEVHSIGRRVGEGAERKGRIWDSWYHNTFGVVGPFVSSLFGLVIVVLALWFLNFFNLPVGSGFASGVYSFVLGNLGLLFVIFLFFSYSSYLSRASPEGYRPVSPLVTAVGITIVLWMAASAISIANISLGIPFFQEAVSLVQDNLPWLFILFLVLGYLAFAALSAFREHAPHKAGEGAAVSRSRARTAVSRQDKGKRLYRSGNDRVLGGVCGGIAEYLGVDPVLIRLLWVLGTLAWGAGILLYIAMWIIMPRNPRHKWRD